MLPKLLTQKLDGPNSVPVERETITPLLPNPTASANPSPLTSAIIRGCSSVLQPSLVPKLLIHVEALEKPVPVEVATSTPLFPKPTTSALPSLLTSAIIRGCSVTLHPSSAPKLSTHKDASADALVGIKAITAAVLRAITLFPKNLFISHPSL